MWDQLISLLGGNLFAGVDQIVRDFKMPPEQLAAYEAAKQKAVLDARTALAQLAQQDRTSARQREEAVKDRTPARLSYLITVGFFGMLGWMFVHGVPVDQSGALLVMLGALGTAWGSVVAYYFGSSAGSDRKTELLHRSRPVEPDAGGRTEEPR